MNEVRRKDILVSNIGFQYNPRLERTSDVLLLLLCMYVLLTVTPLDYETGGTGDFWSKINLHKLKKYIIAIICISFNNSQFSGTLKFF